MHTFNWLKSNDPKKGGRKYAMNGQKAKDIYFQAISMINSAIGWTELYF